MGTTYLTVLSNHFVLCSLKIFSSETTESKKQKNKTNLAGMISLQNDIQQFRDPSKTTTVTKQRKFLNGQNCYIFFLL